MKKIIIEERDEDGDDEFGHYHIEREFNKIKNTDHEELENKFMEKSKKHLKAAEHFKKNGNKKAEKAHRDAADSCKNASYCHGDAHAILDQDGHTLKDKEDAVEMHEHSLVQSDGAEEHSNEVHKKYPAPSTKSESMLVTSFNKFKSILEEGSVTDLGGHKKRKEMSNMQRAVIDSNHPDHGLMNYNATPEHIRSLANHTKSQHLYDLADKVEHVNREIKNGNYPIPGSPLGSITAHVSKILHENHPDGSSLHKTLYTLYGK